MANKKIKYPPNALRKADKEIKDLMKKIIETKRGGTTIKGAKGPSRTLNSISGDLKTRIKPVIKVKNGELVIDIEMVEYYQYLDKGTDRIKNPWFLTDELTSHIKFISSIEKLIAAGIAFSLKKDLKVG